MNNWDLTKMYAGFDNELYKFDVERFLKMVDDAKKSRIRISNN